MATAIEDQLKSIGGQVQLTSPLGRFLQSLVQSVAAVIAGGGLAPQFYEAKNTVPQNIGGQTNFHFDTATAARGISQPDNESFQLTVGKTYHLIFHGNADGFSGVGDSIEFRWVDNNLVNIPQADSIKGVMRPGNSSAASSTDGYADCIYTVPPGGDVVHVRVTNVVGSCVISSGAVQVSIIEIPG